MMRPLQVLLGIPVCDEAPAGFHESLAIPRAPAGPPLLCGEELWGGELRGLQRQQAWPLAWTFPFLLSPRLSALVSHSQVFYGGG